MKLTAELAQALTNLRSNPDFKVFVGALSGDGEKLVETLVMGKESSETPVQRGQARQVTLILKAIAEAPQQLQNFKTKQPPRAI